MQSHRAVLTPFLPELWRWKAHFDQHLLQEPPALVMPGLQPNCHIGGVQHGIVQAPMPHQGETIVVNGTAAQIKRLRDRKTYSVLVF